MLKTFSDFMKQISLIDLWISRNRSIKKTLFLLSGAPFIFEDSFFFIDSTLNSCLNSSDYLGIDHSPLLLNIQLSTYNSSPPLWSVNSLLCADKEFCKLISDSIDEFLSFIKMTPLHVHCYGRHLNATFKVKLFLTLPYLIKRLMLGLTNVHLRLVTLIKVVQMYWTHLLNYFSSGLICKHNSISFQLRRQSGCYDTLVAHINATFKLFYSSWYEFHTDNIKMNRFL